MTPRRSDFFLRAGAETLAADIITAKGCGPARTLFLHGAGQSTRRRQWTLRDTLASHGHASAAIDFSGHGESSALQANSLAKRLAEAQTALDHLRADDDRPFTLVGVSMSGEIAMRLAARPENRIGHLVTVVGAIYDKAAFHLPFGPDFSAALRRPHSWRDAESPTLLSAYPGHVTLVRAMQDTVIPSEVADLVAAGAQAAKSCRIVELPDVDHRVSERCDRDPALRESLARLIAATP